MSYRIAPILLIFLVSCANPVSQKNAIRYEVAAWSNTQSGNWGVARQQWAKAVGNSLGSGDSYKTQAIRWYEYGRALGVTCFFEESEEALLKAYELDQKAGEPLYLSLNELARLNYDQRKYEKAIGYFERSFSELDKANISKVSPYAYADLLDEYASALQKTGKNQASEEAKIKASKLRKKNPEGYSNTDRTPYGSQCTEQLN